MFDGLGITTYIYQYRNDFRKGAKIHFRKWLGGPSPARCMKISIFLVGLGTAHERRVLGNQLSRQHTKRTNHKKKFPKLKPQLALIHHCSHRRRRQAPKRWIICHCHHLLLSSLPLGEMRRGVEEKQRGRREIKGHEGWCYISAYMPHRTCENQFL